MSTLVRRRITLVLAAALAVGALAGCGGGGGGVQSPATPAGAVDPAANGPVTGPINRARSVAEEQEQHDAQLEQQSAGQP